MIATSVPTVYALYRARKYLDAVGANDIALVITGGLRVSSDFAKAFGYGCGCCGSSIGCFDCGSLPAVSYLWYG